MKAAIYTRVSTRKGEQEKSFHTQREHYIEYCQRNGFDLDVEKHIYAEQGLTGTNARRPLFKQLMYDAGLDYEQNNEGTDIFRRSGRKPKFNYIIVKDVSRFSRNQTIGMETARLLKDKGVYVVFENSGVSTEEDNWEFQVSLLFTMAQNESHNLSRRVRFSKRHNAEKGHYRPSRLPYGFIRDKENNYVINEKEAKVVRTIFDMYENYGSFTIARYLNNEGYRSQTGKAWTQDKVGRIVKNKIYTGTAVVSRFQKRNVTDTKTTKLDPSKYIEIPNAVPPIIDIDQWEKAQQITASRINGAKEQKRGRKPAINDEFFEKVYCEKCGSRYVRHMGRNNPKSKVKLSYMCSKRRKALKCDSRSIAFNLLDEFFNQIDIRYLSNAMANKSHYNILTKRIKEEADNLSNRIEVLNSQIKDLEDENKKSLAAMKQHFGGKDEDSKFMIDMLKEDIKKNQEKINELSKKRDSLNMDSIYTLQKHVEDKKRLIEQTVQNKELSREDKLSLLKRISVNDYEVFFEFALPTFAEEVEEFNTLFNMSPIETSISFTSFKESFRRTHKEAVEFWNDYDEKVKEEAEPIENEEDKILH